MSYIKKWFYLKNKSNDRKRNKLHKGVSFSFVFIILLFTACSKNTTPTVESSSSSTEESYKIFLYGETHGVENIINKEFELWCDYYNNKNMRHLFVEMPYYTAEYLNLWMQSDNNDILLEVYKDWEGTASYNTYTKDFFINIKTECPETIFHGTDVGHQYYNTGKRFLQYLEENNLENSDQYNLAQEAIEQGRYYYNNDDDVYRENKMVENFIREYDKLNGESIMGIYGSAHTGLDSMDFSNSVPCMANQLKSTYKDIIYSEDLTMLDKNWIEKMIYNIFN